MRFFFTVAGLFNFPHKIYRRFLFTLETNLNKSFESNAKVGNIPHDPDAQIIFHGTLYILCPQITLDNNFLAYLNGVLKSRSSLRTGVISASYQQSFEITTGTQPFKDKFRGLNKQIEWLEIFFYDKSDQYQTIF